MPLNPTLLEAFQNPIESNLPELLDPTSPQKLMYYLHIIDKLSSSHTGATIIRDNSVSTLAPLISHEKCEEDKATVQRWNDLFIRKGGLRLLYDIMMSGELLVTMLLILGVSGYNEFLIVCVITALNRLYFITTIYIFYRSLKQNHITFK